MSLRSADLTRPAPPPPPQATVTMSAARVVSVRAQARLLGAARP